MLSNDLKITSEFSCLWGHRFSCLWGLRFSCLWGLRFSCLWGHRQRQCHSP